MTGSKLILLRCTEFVTGTSLVAMLINNRLYMTFLTVLAQMFGQVTPGIFVSIFSYGLMAFCLLAIVFAGSVDYLFARLDTQTARS